jgi:hypothetical protein
MRNGPKAANIATARVNLSQSVSLAGKVYSGWGKGQAVFSQFHKGELKRANYTFSVRVTSGRGPGGGIFERSTGR